MTLKEAANVLKINYSSAKTVMQTYKHKGRILKKHSRIGLQKETDLNGLNTPVCSRIFRNPKLLNPLPNSSTLFNNILPIDTNDTQNLSKAQNSNFQVPLEDSSCGHFLKIDFAEYSRKILANYLVRNGPRLRKLQRRIKLRALPVPQGMTIFE